MSALVKQERLIFSSSNYAVRRVKKLEFSRSRYSDLTSICQRRGESILLFYAFITFVGISCKCESRDLRPFIIELVLYYYSHRHT